MEIIFCSLNCQVQGVIQREFYKLLIILGCRLEVEYYLFLVIIFESGLDDYVYRKLL